VKGHTRGDFGAESSREVGREVRAYARAERGCEVRVELARQVRPKVRVEIAREVQLEPASDLRVQREAEFRCEVRVQVLAEVRREMQAQGAAELPSQVEAHVRLDCASDVRNPGAVPAAETREAPVQNATPRREPKAPSRFRSRAIAGLRLRREDDAGGSSGCPTPNRTGLQQGGFDVSYAIVRRAQIEPTI